MAADVKRQAHKPPGPSPGSVYLAKVWRVLFEGLDEWDRREQFKLITRIEPGEGTGKLERVVSYPGFC